MRLLAPLRRTPVALLWGGLSLSALGDQFFAVTLGWVGVALLGEAAGYLTALQFLVLLLAVLGLGGWADTLDQRRAMIVADLGRAAVLAAVAAAWVGLGAPSAPLLVVAVVLLALGQAVFQPALQSVLPGVVGEPALLPAANGLLDATERTARLLGPALVGLLATIVPIVHFLTLDAATFLASALALGWIGRLQPGAARAGGAREPAWRSIARGVRAMGSHPVLGFKLLTAGPLNGAWYATFFFALPLAIERLGVKAPAGGGLGAYGLVISAYGSTNLVSNLVMGGRALGDRPQRVMFAGDWVVGLGMMLLGAALLLPPGWVLPGLMASAGFAALGGPMSDIPTAVLRQTRLRPGDLAASMRASMAVSSAGVLVALLAAPGLVSGLGLVAFIAAMGAVLVGVGAWGSLRFMAWREPDRAGA